jgi:hypothetical protein
MAKRALVPTNNSQHNGYRAADGGKMSAVPALLDQGRESLEALARAYFLAEVAGQARATIDTKRRDLSRFLSFYRELYGHDRPEEWYASVTARGGGAAASLARIYASVRHFARWIHFKVRPFPLGCPTDGIKPPREPEWKGLIARRRVARGDETGVPGDRQGSDAYARNRARGLRAPSPQLRPPGRTGTRAREGPRPWQGSRLRHGAVNAQSCGATSRKRTMTRFRCP